MMRSARWRWRRSRRWSSELPNLASLLAITGVVSIVVAVVILRCTAGFSDISSGAGGARPASWSGTPGASRGSRRPRRPRITHPPRSARWSVRARITLPAPLPVSSPVALVTPRAGGAALPPRPLGPPHSPITMGSRRPRSARQPLGARLALAPGPANMDDHRRREIVSRERARRTALAGCFNGPLDRQVSGSRLRCSCAALC